MQTHEQVDRHEDKSQQTLSMIENCQLDFQVLKVEMCKDNKQFWICLTELNKLSQPSYHQP